MKRTPLIISAIFCSAELLAIHRPLVRAETPNSSPLPAGTAAPTDPAARANFVALLDCAEKVAARDENLYPLRAIIKEWADAGRSDRATELVAEIKRRLPKVSRNIRIETLEVAEAELDRGDPAAALKALDEIRRRADLGNWRDSLYAEVTKRAAVKLAEMDRFDEAQSAADKATSMFYPKPDSSGRLLHGVSDNRLVLEARSEIAKIAVARGREPEAEKILSQLSCEAKITALSGIAGIENDHRKAMQRMERAETELKDKRCTDWMPPIPIHLFIAKQYFQLGERVKADSHLQEARAALASIQEEPQRAYPLLDLALTLLSAGNKPEAVKVLEDAFKAGLQLDERELSSKLHFLKEVAGAMADAGEPVRAEQLAARITSDYNSGAARARIVTSLIKAGKMDQAEAATRAIAYPDHRTSASTALFAAYAQSGEAEKALSWALAALEESTKSLNRINNLVELAHAVRTTGFSKPLSSEKRFRDSCGDVQRRG